MMHKDLEQYLGQLIIPRLNVAAFTNDSLYRDATNNSVEQGLVGGFCIFGGTVESLNQILEGLQFIAKMNGHPQLLMTCDCEWGLPMRLTSGGTEFPHSMALAQSRNRNEIKEVATVIGIEMASLGLHWNFAPIVDVNSNPENPIINIRSFSSDPEEVALCTELFIEGLNVAGIISSAKHFPGHGDTNLDSHRELPIINKTQEEFLNLELLPFSRMIAKKIPSIMTGHISAPKLSSSLGAKGDEQNLPATISPFLTRKLLREEMRFDGVIITDSLEMDGLQKIISDPAEIAVRCICAGADILLMPTDPVAALEGLTSAVRTNRISDDDIEKSLLRIDRLRSRYLNGGLTHFQPDWEANRHLAFQVASNALELVGRIVKPLPLSHVIILASSSAVKNDQISKMLTYFSSAFSAIPVSLIHSESLPRFSDFGEHPLVITMHRPRGSLMGSGTLDLIPAAAKSLAATLQGKGSRPTGLICLGDPYIAETFSTFKPEFILKSFSDSPPSVEAVIDFMKKMF